MKVQLKDTIFQSCILNASGPLCTSEEQLYNIDNSSAGGVVSKTVTWDVRKGNTKPRYFDNFLGSINSMGLPNNGHQYYIKVANNIKKPFIISVGGMNLKEFIDILSNILVSIINFDKKIDGLELNLSCPNIIGKGQVGNDFKALELYLEEIFQIYNKLLYNRENKPIVGIKLPPYFEIVHFKIVAEIISKFPIDFITCINSIGNGLIVNWQTETTAIYPKNGMGGIGGSYVKPTGLSNVRNFYLQFKKLNKDIKIIGCGGIECGKDAFEYILCGAHLLQVGTQFYKENTSCFRRILKELYEIMKSKKYENLEDFRGKLKTIPLQDTHHYHD